MALDRNHYIGRVLAGGYRIERFIGSGAFAYVYYATMTDGQGCAVKIQYNLASDARIRFNRETKVLREIPHNDFLVKYYSDGVTPEGFPYLVMEFIDGITFKEALRRRKVWPIGECCDLILQLCDAFGDLHQLGVVHRDVKPDNIMITRSHQVKLMDLGLIKDAQGLFQLLESEDIMEGRDFAENLDKGVLAGTPEYMAPEQFSDPSLADETQAKTDTWTDVYSLGLIFYEMLVGKKLFVFSPPPYAQQNEYAKALLGFLQMRTQQRDEEIVPPQAIPYQLWTVIARALHADPTQRQRNASEFASDLRHYLTTGEGVVEHDNDKTSAIDLATFQSVLKNRGAGVVGAPAADESFQYGSVPSGMQAPVQSVSGLPVIPTAAPTYAVPDVDEGEGNFWLWAILILLLVIVVAGLCVILLWID